MPTILRSVATLSLTLMLGACGSTPEQTSGSTSPVPAPVSGAPVAPVFAVDVPILGKVVGDQLAGDGYGVKLLRTDELAGTGLDQAFSAAGVELDAERHSVVLLALGEQPGAGYAADITALQLKGKSLYVQGVVTIPDDGAGDASGVTRPFAAVAIEHVPTGTVIRSDID